MATILISGGTGLIGTALSRELRRRGHSIVILTRRPQDSAREKGVSQASWDPAAGRIDPGALRDADHIVHLAGANVAEKRWTEARKKEIVDSRVQSGALLARALRALPNQVRSVVSASGIGWYGPDPQVPNPRPFTEGDPVDQDFLGQTCCLWEEAIQPVTEAGRRLVILRTGLALSRAGGAYSEFRKTLPLGVASVLGDGKQVVSWIHIQDLVRMYADALENESWQGVYNAVAPAPVSNKELVLAIARQRGKPYLKLHVPQLALKLLLGELSVEVLKSATVASPRLASAGFQFRYPTIAQAVQDLEKEA